MGKMASSPPPQTPWALFIGEVETPISVLFPRWDEILHEGPQIFTTRPMDAAIKSLDI
jgi:hypothetical protein